MDHLFDRILKRENTNSLKWDSGRPGALPFWVADMDFEAPAPVLEALSDRISHPVFGYPWHHKDYLEAVARWYKTRHGVEVDSRQILAAPGLMPALGQALRALTAPGDGVLVFTPVYQPFFDLVTLGGRRLVTAPLSLEGLKWTFDTEAVRELLGAQKSAGTPVKALLFCSPHNPLGRVWDQRELQDLEALVLEFDLLVLSDEIHQDLVFAPHKHQVLAAFSPELGQRTLSFSSGGKTFNLAGLPLAHVVSFHPGLLARVEEVQKADFFHHPDVLAVTAATAAFLHAGLWLDELLTYLEENYRYLCRHLPLGAVNRLPSQLEGTYLAWLDFRPLMRRWDLESDTALTKKLETQGGIRLSPGSWFGSPPGFQRWNLACPRAQLAAGLDRLKALL